MALLPHSFHASRDREIDSAQAIRALSYFWSAPVGTAPVDQGTRSIDDPSTKRILDVARGHPASGVRYSPPNSWSLTAGVPNGVRRTPRSWRQNRDRTATDDPDVW